MLQAIELNEMQVDAVRRLAATQRCALGLIGETPLAKEIFAILDRLDIVLVEYPIRSTNEPSSPSAALVYSRVDGEEMTFLGLNTADYLDNQIFAVAHELYHFFTKTGSGTEPADALIEVQANRFAAELLLPEQVLESIILREFKSSSLRNLRTKTLLRFVARLQCTWWLPYRSLVRRFVEIGAISEGQYGQLCTINERDNSSEYGQLGKAIDREVFQKLNTATGTVGCSPNAIEMIIRNFEDGIIDEDRLKSILELFSKTPDDFGYARDIADADMEEMRSFLSQEADDEGQPICS